MDDDERSQTVSTKKSSELFSLANKVVIVTGGAGLLGQVFCQALVDVGAHVAIVDLDLASAETAAKRINKSDTQRVIAFGSQIQVKLYLTQRRPLFVHLTC